MHRVPLSLIALLVSSTCLAEPAPGSAERLEAGILDSDTIFAVLQRQDGQWRVRDYVVGPTDVAWAGWAEDFQAPAGLFVLP